MWLWEGSLSISLFDYLHRVVLRLWRLEEVEYNWEGRLVCIKILNRAIDFRVIGVSKRMGY